MTRSWFSRVFIAFIGLSLVLVMPASAGPHDTTCFRWLRNFVADLLPKSPKQFDVSQRERIVENLPGTEGGVQVWVLRSGKKVTVKDLSMAHRRKTALEVEAAILEWKRSGYAVPEYLGTFYKNGRTFVVQEYLRGVRLGIDRLNPEDFTRKQAQEFVEQAHDLAGHHPDPSPGNILYDPDSRMFYALDIFNPPRKQPGGISVPIRKVLESFDSFHQLDPPGPRGATGSPK